MVKFKNENPISSWNYIYLFIGIFLLFSLLFSSLFNLQVVRSQELGAKSESNQVNVRYIYPDRGVIFDRNGKLLAQNIPSTDLYLNFTQYINDNDELDETKLATTLGEIELVIGEKWKTQEKESQTFDTLNEKISYAYEYMLIYPDLAKLATNGSYEKAAKSDIDQLLTNRLGERWLALVKANEFDTAFKIVWRNLEDAYYQKEGQIATNITNEQTIKIKSLSEKLPGVRLDESNKRNYQYGEAFSHILGYTSPVTAEDWESLDYIGLNDVVGRLGLERIYDEQLIGEKGLAAVETDAFGTQISDSERVIKEPVSGKNLVLSIDADAQAKMYELLKSATAKYNATGAAGILQDSNTGEIITISSYPSFDNNLFIEGLSEDQYKVLSDPRATPMLNRAVSAQLPPGSTFKTIGAAAGIDSKAINLSTVYTSTSNYTFSNGAPFQEYHNHAYGRLDVTDALMVSSNIFFCEMIRDWDIEEYDDYLEAFGIGEYTGIDLTGEGQGRVPSPKNKIALAKMPGVTWLEPIWYPEGDGCNSVIGQGIALVTPIQMANWTSAIANGGTLNTPHLGVKFTNADGQEKALEYKPLNENFIKSSSLQVVREGMRAAVAGPRKSISALTDAKVHVAAKTGTAEFGAVNSKGVYEHTHAWVTGFFPYEDPKYTFTILLEDGGESFHSAQVAREFIDWYVDAGLVK